MNLNNNVLKNEEDDNLNDEVFLKFLEHKNDLEKKSLAKDLILKGDKYLKEIDKKTKKKEKRKNEQIQFITNKMPNSYDLDDLLSYSFEEINELYLKVKSDSKSFFIKILKFLFGIN